MSRPVQMPPAIHECFERLVNKPYRQHNRTPAWVREVENRHWADQRVQILDWGLTDFDSPSNGLPPEDKVIVYCYSYLQMHVASNLHVFDVAMRQHGMGFSRYNVILDFGCGPLTLGIALAWQNLMTMGHTEGSPRLLLHYLGIDRSQSMRKQAKTIADQSGLFHSRSTFWFVDDSANVDDICRQIDDLLSAVHPVNAELILNCSYFFSSKSLVVPNLAAAVRQIFGRYPRVKSWLVYQNPDYREHSANWRRFKTLFPELTSVTGGDVGEKIQYHNTTNRTGQVRNIHLRYEVLSRQSTVAVPVRCTLGVASAKPSPGHERIADEDIPF